MLNAANPRFLGPADNTRPYKSHRYDVFGLKIDRTVTLFGGAALNAWITLEASPAVLAYCERPLVIADVKPKRIVDFWVRLTDGEELWLIQRADELEPQKTPVEIWPGFAAWAANAGMPVRLVSPEIPGDNALYLENWGRIIRELSANRRFVPGAMVDKVLECVTSARPLAALTGLFPDDDPVLLRTAAFTLLHSGKLRCQDVATAAIGPHSMLEPA